MHQVRYFLALCEDLNFTQPNAATCPSLRSLGRSSSWKASCVERFSTASEPIPTSLNLDGSSVLILSRCITR